MVALFNKNPILDPSKKAEEVLDYVLADAAPETVTQKENTTSVEAELKLAPLTETVSDRKLSRVLFITRDLNVLQENTLQQLHYKNLGDMFAEVHVMVLADVTQAKQGVLRLGNNIWVYTATSQSFFTLPFAAYEVARLQLRFTDGFRPDVIVAVDPFESGLIGLLLAQKYDREFQVHITEDFFLPEFRQKEKRNSWRVRIASYVLKRTVSVRTATTTLREKVEKKLRHTKDIEVLPRHYDIESLVQASGQDAYDDAFPQFAFTVLFVGVLDHDSTLFRAIDAARSILNSKNIGMAVLGDGPVKKECQQRAAILGIQDQILFRNDQSLLTSYLQSADILLCTDTSEASDELIIKAAASGLPILAAETPLRTDLFTDGTDAFLCSKDDTVCFSQKLVKFLNGNGLRMQFTENAKEVVKTRLHEDPMAFKTAYRDSVEGVFVHSA